MTGNLQVWWMVVQTERELALQRAQRPGHDGRPAPRRRSRFPWQRRSSAGHPRTTAGFRLTRAS